MLQAYLPAIKLAVLIFAIGGGSMIAVAGYLLFFWRGGKP